MRLSPLVRAGTLAAGVIAALTPPAAAQDTWALTNARIETVTRGVIDRGTIVIRNGLIVAVGATVSVPADARVLDLTGRTVYPGMIDLTSSLGLPAAAAPGGGGPGGGGAAARAGAANANASDPRGLEPERMISDELRASAADIKAARDAGFTAVLAAPSRGVFRGQSALVPLKDSVTGRDVLRSPVAMQMGLQTAQGGGFGARSYPGSMMGIVAYSRQAFYDARRQGQRQDRYRRNPRGMERPVNDPSISALVPAVRGEMPVLFAAGTESEMVRALNLAREFDLQMTLVGATEGFRIVDQLVAARRPVVVSMDFPRSPQVTGWQYQFAQRRAPNDSAAADSAVRAVVEANAATLNRAGVRIALASGSLRPAEFMANVRKAIAAGLPRDSALAALTIRPAEIAGAAEQLGSIEVGKIANLVVTEGDLLGDSGKVRMVFVDGESYDIVAPAPAAAGGGRGRPGGRGGPSGAGGRGGVPAEVEGTWDVRVNTPQGEQLSSLTVTQSGATFGGAMTNQMGTNPISGGMISGSNVSWSITLAMGERSMTIEFRGSVDGTRMTGAAALGEFGSAPFTAEKRP